MKAASPGQGGVRTLAATDISETIQRTEQIMEKNHSLILEMTRRMGLLRQKRALLRRFPTVAARLKAHADADYLIQPDVVYAQRRGRSTPYDAKDTGCVRLRIDFGGGLPLNDYRIRGGLLEFRVLDKLGNPYTDGSSQWRVVHSNDIQLHHALGTVLSKWLRVRFSRFGALD